MLFGSELLSHSKGMKNKIIKCELAKTVSKNKSLLFVNMDFPRPESGRIAFRLHLFRIRFDNKLVIYYFCFFRLPHLLELCLARFIARI